MNGETCSDAAEKVQMWETLPDIPGKYELKNFKDAQLGCTFSLQISRLIWSILMQCVS